MTALPRCLDDASMRIKTRIAREHDELHLSCPHLSPRSQRYGIPPKRACIAF
jgi:hypothetical protein